MLQILILAFFLLEMGAATIDPQNIDPEEVCASATKKPQTLSLAFQTYNELDTMENSNWQVSDDSEYFSEGNTFLDPAAKNCHKEISKSKGIWVIPLLSKSENGIKFFSNSSLPHPLITQLTHQMDPRVTKLRIKFLLISSTAPTINITTSENENITISTELNILKLMVNSERKYACGWSEIEIDLQPCYSVTIDAMGVERGVFLIDKITLYFSFYKPQGHIEEFLQKTTVDKRIQLFISFSIGICIVLFVFFCFGPWCM